MTQTDFSTLTRQALDTCHALAQHTEVPGEITRTFLAPCAADLHTDLRAWADRLGMTTQVDAAGNLRSRLECPDPAAPTLYLGSHLDTVPNGGAYDGLLGVVLAYALVEAVRGSPLPYHLEVLGFSEEEGVRFGVSFIGSRALVGTAQDLFGRTDRQGVKVMDAIRQFGLNPDLLPQARVQGKALGYLEFHIEQGPVLQDLGAPVGIVSGIVGQDRLRLTFTGQAAHAGTTPMRLRRDALAAAARFIVSAEEVARSTPGLVATVGMIEARPGAGNVIPGEVVCSLDLRHLQDDLRAEVQGRLLDGVRQECQERGVALAVTPLMAERATPMSGPLRQALHAAAEAAGLPHPELVSGAGHDAQIMAQIMPAAMLFIRSPNALSHHPDEMVNAEDVQAALTVGAGFLKRLEVEHA